MERLAKSFMRLASSTSAPSSIGRASADVPAEEVGAINGHLTATGADAKEVASWAAALERAHDDAWQFPPGVSQGWGSSAALHGVYKDSDSSLIFGHTRVTYKKPIEIKECCAPFAPNVQRYQRDKWCTNPRKCKASDHDRPANLTEDDIEKGKAPPYDPAWAEVFAPSAKRQRNEAGYTARGRGSAGGGRSDGGKGGRSKGSGGKGSGAKGKGKGARGKGDGKGKGKGKGGWNFQWRQ